MWRLWRTLGIILTWPYIVLTRLISEPPMACEGCGSNVAVGEAHDPSCPIKATKGRSGGHAAVGMLGTAAVLALLFSGCATVEVGRPFDPAVFQGFVAGQTTQAEVLAAAGPPWSRSTLPDGSAVWTYFHSKSNTATIPLVFYTHIETDGQTKAITVTFRDGVLSKTSAPGR